MSIHFVSTIPEDEILSHLVPRSVACYIGLVNLVHPAMYDRGAGLGQDRFLAIKYPVFISTGFVTFAWFILSRTTFGRYVYAIGGNAEAAWLSGVRGGLIRTFTFCLTGLAAGLAGVITVSRIAQGVADIGVGVELDAIAATVIGGTSILGGEGAIWRTVIGVLLLCLIGNGFNL